ncbi:MAG: hypothetical protein ACYDDU_03895 [Dermatophilaceae bacterium]
MATTDHRDDLVCRLCRLPEQQHKIVVLRYYADRVPARTRPRPTWVNADGSLGHKEVTQKQGS